MANFTKHIKELHSLKTGDKFEVVESPNSRLEGIICEFIEWSGIFGTTCKVVKGNKFFFWKETYFI